MRNSLLILLLLFMLSGCNYFTTRKAEDPAQNVPWNIYPTSPDLLLQNLEYSWTYRGNVSRYTDLFADDYVFYFDAQDVADLNISDTPYTKDQEEETLANLWSHIDENSEVLYTLNPDTQEDEIHADYAHLYRVYLLNLPHDVSTEPTLVNGRMELYMVKQESGYWKIKWWRDSRNESTTTWGVIKNAF